MSSKSDEVVNWAINKAKTTSGPVALLVEKILLKIEHPKSKTYNNLLMREEVIDIILDKSSKILTLFQALAKFLANCMRQRQKKAKSLKRFPHCWLYGFFITNSFWHFNYKARLKY